MRRHLAAIDRAMRAHRGLQIGMARRGHHRPPPGPRHHILSVPDHPWVMHNGRPRLFGQKHLGQKAHDIFPRRKGSGFVKEKTAVEIAVPSHPQIGPLGAHGLGRHRLVFGQKRVWDAIGETAIRRVVQPDKLQRRARRRQCSRQGVKCRPRRPVARVHHHAQRPQCRHVDKGHHPRHILGPRVHRGQNTLPHRAERTRLSPRPHGGENRCRQRLCPRSDQLHPVVIHRIVAGRHLDARIRAQMVGGKIHLLRAAQAQKQHLRPGRPQPLRRRRRQFLGRGARIMAQDHPARAQFLGKGPRDGAHDIGG